MYMKRDSQDIESEKENRRSPIFLSTQSNRKHNQSFKHPKSVTPRSSTSKTKAKITIPAISQSNFKTQQQLIYPKSNFEFQYSEHDFQTIAQILTLAEKMLNKCDKNGSHFNLNITQHNNNIQSKTLNKSFDPHSIHSSTDQSTSVIKSFDSRNIMISQSTNRSFVNTILSQQSIIASNP